MELSLTTPIQYIPRVGPVMAAKLKKLGVETVEDILWYVPFRYDDYSLKSPISRVQAGETVTIRGTVERMTNAFTKTGKKLQQAKVTDASGTIDVVWFNQPFLAQTIHKGDNVNLSGKVEWFGNKVVMQSPEYELVEDNHAVSLHTGRLVPIYPETEGLSSKWLRGRVHFVIKECIHKVFEYIPNSIRNKYGLIEIQKAIEYIHFPIDKNSAKDALRRLSFDELFLTLLQAHEQKRLWQTTQHAHPISLARGPLANIVQTLPFSLTGDQQKALTEILDDLAKPIPMNRLLEGDVGSGKTVVAAIAMYVAYKNGFRSVCMAPTQILAEQHFATIKKMLDPMGIDIGLVTGNKKMNQAPVLIGTHALLHQSFNNVGLVVIDEQHRFGVKQRMQLTKGNGNKTPHLLTMTATPIPRTVARAIYGNLDLSILETMPSGRKKVKTWVVPKEKRKNAYEWITKKLQETGGQAFIICPLIEDSETLSSVKAVKSEYARLQKVFPKLSIGLLHGRLKPKGKTAVLERFQTGKDAILLSTPVVEVGIDIPNAVIMLIEGAERFGLSQLHQLRGRVGRGRIASFCLLFTESDDPTTTKRLKALETIHSGPKLAEVDLSLRGPGELFGTRQHGLPLFKVASFSDTLLLAQTQEAIRLLTSESPDLAQFPQLRERVKKGIIMRTGD
ncbi:ATP-dependent DNA helicase RecG [Candidatus Gottesmanbacteria bacterium]|nr:ATP-dependent DNA helicase RecG [Candidatus Gottesmanbacteria bacterium]